MKDKIPQKRERALPSPLLLRVISFFLLYHLSSLITSILNTLHTRSLLSHLFTPLNTNCSASASLTVTIFSLSPSPVRNEDLFAQRLHLTSQSSEMSVTIILIWMFTFHLINYLFNFSLRNAFSLFRWCLHFIGITCALQSRVRKGLMFHLSTVNTIFLLSMSPWWSHFSSIVNFHLCESSFPLPLSVSIAPTFIHYKVSLSLSPSPPLHSLPLCILLYSPSPFLSSFKYTNWFCTLETCEEERRDKIISETHCA